MAQRARVLADLGEDELLARTFPLLPGGPGVRVGPGDDAAWLSAPHGDVVATTDTMVRGLDWLDEWSQPGDVGAKVVAQNLADIAAMGAVASALLVTLIADPQTPVAWVEGFTAGLAAASAAAGVPVAGGDLSAAPAGTVAVSITALGTTEGRAPVLRAGAGAGDVVALAGSLGRSAAGLRLLQLGRSAQWPDLVGCHRRPKPPYAAGPAAARAGATAMIDLSDGLGRDAGRLARASGVCLQLQPSALGEHVAVLVPALGEQEAWECVLSGGEEHSLLATFPAATVLPQPWRVVGVVRAGPAGVRLGDEALGARGWDHFGG